MIDSLKKTLLAGIGAAVITKEKVESTLHEFVAQGKVSAADARKIAEKIAADGRQEFEHVSEQLGAKLKELLVRNDQQTQERIAALEARVQALEARGASAAPGRQS
ncbi:MAG: phasin family protein [Opitutales bacterium]